MIPSSAPSAAKILTESQAAAWLGCSRSTLRAWRAAGTGPRARRIGRRMIRYALDDLRQFAASGAPQGRSEASLPDFAEHFDVYGFQISGMCDGQESDWETTKYGPNLTSVKALKPGCQLILDDSDNWPVAVRISQTAWIWYSPNEYFGGAVFVPKEAENDAH